MMNLKDYLNYLMLSTRSIIKVSLFIVLFIIPANGQEHTGTTILPDTTFAMQKSPWGAVLRSAILPGLGQFYNESYWKIPVIWGVGALLLSGWFYYDNLYEDYRDLFIETGNTSYKSYRDFYRDQRDNFTIYLIVTYLLNLVDAYVDAQLFDFEVEEYYGSPTWKLNFHYNLGRINY